MKFEKEITLVTFEVEYYDHRQPKPRPLLREDVILDGGRISALERLGIRPAGYITEQFNRNGFTVSAVRWGEKLTARVDLDALWSSTQMRIQAAKLTEMFRNAKEGDGQDEQDGN